ncbi:IclR family transcriptional regulator [Achromobacter sp. UMC46]|uniref:IclR family transcriptional regulator n=1 Tax=Achromobacter sp. UMC46 TaxID=1862319 RepID=UPI0015FFD3E0|nr:IclR family transcriptional regulator [Achromobacter sp. UMC46]MBB1597025.1 IclR family transcriptional regulator [Achromobacter sp. UMC46]
MNAPREKSSRAARPDAAPTASAAASASSPALGATSVAGTASFSKFMRVLDAIALDGDTAWTVNALSARLGYPRPTIYRIVEALIAEQLLVPKRNGQSFGLGPRLVSLASRALESSDIRQLCKDHLFDLRALTQETVHLAVPDRSEMTYIDKLESPKAVRMNSRLGSRVTMYSSSVGKAYLARLPPDERDAVIQTLEFLVFTEATLRTPQALHRELEQIRRQGYAEDREENEKDIFCFGCAITDKQGAPVACVSLSIPAFRMSANRTDSYIKPLVDTCAAISRKLAVLDFSG